MARMRTIDGLFKAIHEIDPASEISKNYVRNLVLSGKIKGVVKAGSKRIANLDEVLYFLENPTNEEEANPNYGIRKINGWNKKKPLHKSGGKMAVILVWINS